MQRQVPSDCPALRCPPHALLQSPGCLKHLTRPCLFQSLALLTPSWADEGWVPRNGALFPPNPSQIVDWAASKQDLPTWNASGSLAAEKSSFPAILHLCLAPSYSRGACNFAVGEMPPGRIQFKQLSLQPSFLHLELPKIWLSSDYQWDAMWSLRNIHKLLMLIDCMGSIFCSWCGSF